MKSKYVGVGMGVLLIVLWGCQASQTPREKDKQANAYVQQAQAYESQGNLVEALEQYELAQTIDPDEPVITEGIKRLDQKLTDLAEAHYQAGLRFRDKGKWDLAKKEFLKTIRYRPDHKNAAAMLQQRQPDGKRAFITHVIAPGESISKLALKYYGDYKKYHHIANFNTMTDATRVRVGQPIMVPVIDGVTIDDLIRISTGSPAQPSAVQEAYTIHQIQPGESLAKVAQIYYGDYKLFHVIASYNGITDPASIKVGQKVKVPRLEPSVEPETDSPYLPEASESKPVAELPGSPAQSADAARSEASDTVDQVTGYRQMGIDLFNQQKYDEAIVEFQKVLNAAPEDADAIDYISRAYVETGREHLAANRLNDAKTAFITALDYDENCAECQALLARCRTIEADILTKEGETLFQNNQFDEAISTLERAVALNPGDATATNLLFQTHFQKALILYNKQDHLAAVSSFEKAAAIQSDCSECKRYIETVWRNTKNSTIMKALPFSARKR
jgi:tetratricopeptide (TPR) repeat protein